MIDSPALKDSVLRLPYNIFSQIGQAMALRNKKEDYRRTTLHQVFLRVYLLNRVYLGQNFYTITNMETSLQMHRY